MFPVKNQSNHFVILQSFFRTICTLLQCFPKNSFAADVMRSKCLHATSSNAPFCTYYVDDLNYCSLIMVTFPLGSMEKCLRHVKMRVRYLLAENYCVVHGIILLIFLINCAANPRWRTSLFSQGKHETATFCSWGTWKIIVHALSNQRPTNVTL